MGLTAFYLFNNLMIFEVQFQKCHYYSYLREYMGFRAAA